MITEKKLTRINKLAQKEKKEGLTEKEKMEQHELRQEYLENVRHSFKNQFKSMTVKDRKGNDVTPKKVKEMKQRNKHHE